MRHGRSAGWGRLALALGLALCACDPPEDAEIERSAAEAAPSPSPRAAAEAPAPEPVAAPGSTVAPSAGEAEALRPPWPPTALPLALLATLEAREADESRATIRDEQTGTIASYRPGDSVREQVRVLAIEEGLVELSNDGEVEYLSVSMIPVELSADDVFYPDFVDDLQLSGSMEESVQLTPALEYTVRAPAYAWGTPRTIARLREAIRAYARQRKSPKVHVGDISVQHGGPFPPHISHQEGRDVDIAYVLHHSRSRFGEATASTLDRARTWALIRALLDTEAVLYVFVDYEVQRLLYEHALAEGVSEAELDRLFQYPHGRRAAHGVIRHWKGHRDHFHVRFAP